MPASRRAHANSRRTSRTPRRRWLAACLVAVTVLAAAGTLLGCDALAAHDALRSARQELASARTAIAAGDISSARERLDAAQELISDAGGRTGTPLWRLAANVPVAGRSLRIIGGVVEVADAAAGATDSALGRAGDLLGRDGDLAIEVRDGAVALAPLRRAAAA